jgi:hypothetical protein
MIGRISVVAISICIGACASSGPEAPAASSASVDAVASDNPSAPPAGDLHEPDASDVEKTASDSEEIVCRREKATGTKMTRTVCRTRADIDARAAKDQDALGQSRSGTGAPEN